MKKKIIALLLLLACILSVTACSEALSSSSFSPSSISEPSFKVTFIDVGQGDAALVECDDEYMLIDVGTNTKSSSEKIRGLLRDKGIYELKYLVISHWHDDHYGGLRQKPSVLQNITEIEYLLCNKDPYEEKKVADILPVISESTDEIVIPKVKDSYELGNATIKVIDVSTEGDNDSLVLLITYGKTNFLFTGDIEEKAQSRVASSLREIEKTLQTGENLIKMPHHGAYNSDRALPADASDNYLATLVGASCAKYFVISVGKNNSYKHPDERTLEIIYQALGNNDVNSHFFRTDTDGDLVFSSNGKKITLQ